MANIQSYLKAIEEAVYGEEVRGSIRDAIQKVNDDNESYIAIKEEIKGTAASIEKDIDAAKQSAADATAAAERADEVQSKLDASVDKVNAAVESAETAVTAAQEAVNQANSAKAEVVQASEDAQNAATEARTSATASESHAVQAKAAADTAQANAEEILASVSSAAESATNAAASSAEASAASASAKADAKTASDAQAAASLSQTAAEKSAEAAAKSAKDAELAAGGGVISFNGRGGSVAPQKGDYTAEMVGADSEGSAAAVQEWVTAQGYLLSSQKGAQNGVASLDENGLIPKEQIPDDVSGAGTFLITYSITTEDGVDTAASDQTLEEIKAAFTAGKRVYANVVSEGNSGIGFKDVPVIYNVTSNSELVLVPITIAGGNSFTILQSADGIAVDSYDTDSQIDKVKETIEARGYQTSDQVEAAITGKGYQTAAEVETAIAGKGYQTAAQVETIVTGKGYQTSEEVENAIKAKGYQTASQVENTVTGKGYQTEAQVNSLFSTMITAQTADLTAGTSALTTGRIVLVYE